MVGGMVKFSVRTVIDAHGGLDAIAAKCGVSPDAVYKWRQSGRIPPKHWPHLVNKRISYAALAALDGGKTEAA